VARKNGAPYAPPARLAGTGGRPDTDSARGRLRPWAAAQQGRTAAQTLSAAPEAAPRPRPARARAGRSRPQPRRRPSRSSAARPSSWPAPLHSAAPSANLGHPLPPCHGRARQGGCARLAHEHLEGALGHARAQRRTDRPAWWLEAAVWHRQLRWSVSQHQGVTTAGPVQSAEHTKKRRTTRHHKPCACALTRPSKTLSRALTRLRAAVPGTLPSAASGCARGSSARCCKCSTLRA